MGMQKLLPAGKLCSNLCGLILLLQKSPDRGSHARSLLNTGHVATDRRVLFAGGSSGSWSSTVDAYDEDLIHTVAAALSTPQLLCRAASVGSYYLVGGGLVSESAYSDVTEAYEAC